MICKELNNYSGKNIFTEILKTQNDYTECTPVTTNTNTRQNAGQMSSAARQC